MTLKNTLFKPANYIHNNGDKEYVIIIGYDKKGNAWIKWNDHFINMVPVTRLEVIDND
jgi:hypothetical protein